MPNKLSEFEQARRLDIGLAKLKKAYKLLGEIGRRLEEKYGKTKKRWNSTKPRFGR